MSESAEPADSAESTESTEPVEVVKPVKAVKAVKAAPRKAPAKKAAPAVVLEPDAGLEQPPPVLEQLPPVTEGRPVLEIRGVIAGYGSVTVVRPIDITLSAGTVLALLGPNGAGKTTLMMTLAGLLPRMGGSVSIDGTSLPPNRPSFSNRNGMILVPDDRALFMTLTVKENMVIARRKGAPTVDDLLDLFPALKPRLNINAGSLSGGEQQMLAVARGMAQKPRVLLIDEMSMGLAPVIVEGLLPVVRRIADETGAVVILVEQHVRLALEVADRAMVLVHGEVSLEGSADSLAADAGALEAAYLSSPDHVSA